MKNGIYFVCHVTKSSITEMRSAASRLHKNWSKGCTALGLWFLNHFSHPFPNAVEHTFSQRTPTLLEWYVCICTHANWRLLVIWKWTQHSQKRFSQKDISMNFISLFFNIFQRSVLGIQVYKKLWSHPRCFNCDIINGIICRLEMFDRLNFWKMRSLSKWKHWVLSHRFSVSNSSYHRFGNYCLHLMKIFVFNGLCRHLTPTQPACQLGCG